MQAFYIDWVQQFGSHTFSTQIRYIVKNVPNLCRKLAHRYMQAFYTDWVYKVFWHFLKMYPICVECLHIGICKHSTQIGYIRLTPIPFLHKLGTFSKMCPICVECLRILRNPFHHELGQKSIDKRVETHVFDLLIIHTNFIK